MASVITEFLASVGFQTDEKSLRRSLTKVAAFGAAIKMVTAGIVAGVTQAANAEAELARKAELLGTTTEKLRELEYIADQSGVSIDSVTSAMEGLVKKNPRIRDTAAALDLVSRRMKGMGDAQRRVYASRIGIDPKLIPMLTSDVAGLQQEFREMYAVANIDAKQAAESSRGLLAELGKLKTLGNLLKSSISASFAGRIRDDIKRLRMFITENFNRIKAVLATVIDFFFRVSDTINVLASRAKDWLGDLLAWYDKLDDGRKKLVVGLGLFLAAWKLLNLGFIATPLGAIITGLITIGLLIDDYLTYMRGGDSYFGDKWEEWGVAIEFVISLLKFAWGLVKALANGILTALGPAVDTIKTFFADLMGYLALVAKMFQALFSGDFGGALEYAGKALAALGTLIKNVFLGLTKIITGFFKGLWKGIEKSFPNFAAWAKGAATSIKGFFGLAVDRVQDFFRGLMGYFRLVGGMFKALFSGDFNAALEYAKKIFKVWITFIKDVFLGWIDFVAGLFMALWDGVRENFPDFAAWAEEAAASIKEFFAPAIDWLKKGLGKIIDGLTWAGKKLGLIDDTPEDQKLDPEVAAAVHGKVMDGVNNAIGAVMGLAQSGKMPVLVPSPAETAMINNANNSKSVSLQAETTINVTSPDPVAAGRQVATQQDRVNGDLARNMRGKVR